MTLKGKLFRAAEELEDGVRQFVVVTHIDQLGVPNDDMKNAYKYPCIRAFCEKVSEAYGVDLLHVIPLSNYFEEVASNDAKNAMSLYNLWRVFESGKEYIERRIEDEERFFGKENALIYMKARMSNSLPANCFETDDSQPTLKKLCWRCKSPTEKGIVEPILKATKITFEYGPPELNFFKFLAEETHFLWEKAKEIQSDNNEPMNSIVLIHDEDTEVAEHCLHYFDFDLPSKVLESADCLLNGKPEVICVFLLRETFWKATNIPFEQVLNNVVKKVAKANVFFMVSDEDISRAYDFCKKHNVCQGSNVISQGGDKRFFYDTFYDILERQMNSFLHALHTRTDTKDATIREELYSLIEQLRTRKIKTKPKLTTDCLARINESREFGVVGYRLLEKELFVFEDGPVKMEAEKRMHLENYIQKVFNGKVKIIPLREILKPHCAIECGSFITNGALNKGATIGIFGNMQNLDRSGVEKTVALSSPNLLSEGDHACLPNGENIGVCFWPVKPESQVENLCDVSIIEIDSSRLDTVKRTIFDKHIIVEEIPHEDLDYKQVFKYGAKTKTTYGWIKKINDFQLFESDVLVILPKSPAKSFSEEGDSGAIVVTKIKGNYYGVGMVYGSHFDLDNTTNNNAQIATIGIILKNALERFTGIKKMSIQFDKI